MMTQLHTNSGTRNPYPPATVYQENGPEIVVYGYQHNTTGELIYGYNENIDPIADPSHVDNAGRLSVFNRHHEFGKTDWRRITDEAEWVILKARYEQEHDTGVTEGGILVPRAVEEEMREAKKAELRQMLAKMEQEDADLARGKGNGQVEIHTGSKARSELTAEDAKKLRRDDELSVDVSQQAEQQYDHSRPTVDIDTARKQAEQNGAPLGSVSLEELISPNKQTDSASLDAARGESGRQEAAKATAAKKTTRRKAPPRAKPK